MARAPHPLSEALRQPLEAVTSLGRQLQREWRAGPVHQLAIARPKTDGLSIRPRDFRPADAGAGARLFGGDFSFGGERLALGPSGDPWRRALPSRRFAAALHSFDWMRELIAVGEAGQRDALRLWLEWRAVYGRYNAFVWSGEPLERRVFNLATSAAALAPLVSEAEGATFVSDLAKQARHLLGDPADPGRAAERAAVAALVGAALSGKAGEGLRARALPRLERLLPLAVLRDGVHASRSPERGLELLFDLLTLDDALSQLGAPAPVEVSRAVDRLSAATRFFTLADGRLPAFQGGEGGPRARVAAALALDAAEHPPPKSAPYGGYHRLEGRGLQIIADAGEVGGGDAACVQPGALAVVGDGRRLISASAWSAKAAAGPAQRGPSGGSCLALGGALPAPAQTRAERQEGEGAVWLDAAHDGWRAQGFEASRRLFLDTVAGELRGEDALTPIGRPRGEPASFAIRFHLAPDVTAQLSADGKSALLRPNAIRGAGWRLRGDSAGMELARGVAFENGEARATQVLTLVGLAAPASGARVRWKLSRDEG